MGQARLQHWTDAIPVCVVEPSGNPRPLDDILPWRTRLVPADDPCESCGHLPSTCEDGCC